MVTTSSGTSTATLTVGPNSQFATIAAAVAAASNGDTIQVAAGTYTNDFSTISKSITLVGVGGMVNLVATIAPPNGKAILVVGGAGVNVTISNFSFSGAAVPDGNGAGIRYEGGNLTLNGDYFHDNQDGLLAAADPSGSITIDSSEFAHNGTGDGFTHNLYVGQVGTLTIKNSYFHDAVVGHEIKSRALNTVIENSRIQNGKNGTASYNIDLPNGGNALITNNVIEKGPNAQNPNMIAFGEEGGVYSGSALTISGNTVLNDDSSSVYLLWNATSVTANVSNNQTYGLSSSHLVNGSATISGTTNLASEPTLQTTHPWEVSTGITLTGGSGNDTLTGGVGNDTLNGKAGTDAMAGGTGNDTYFVDNAGDVVTESVGGGTDTVWASVSYSLATAAETNSEVEALRANTTAGVTLTGNQFTHTIVGGVGNDTLNGGIGNDTLNGKAGADAMAAGTGNDTYVVDNAGDVVTESMGGGADTVWVSVGYSLATAAEANSEVEALRANTTAGVTLTGNQFTHTIVGDVGNDTLNGGSGNDTLNGKAGADAMAGGAGNDTYVVDDVGDLVSEGASLGSDTVKTTLISYALGANVENLTFIGAGNFTGNGNSLNNVLIGGAGSDTLSGGVGNDTLNGGSGQDSFLFNTALNAASNVDHIVNFSIVDDMMLLSHLVFAALGPVGSLPAGEFFIGAGAGDADDRIIYNSSSGALSYDPDGTGAASATQFAALSSGLALISPNFQIV